MANTFTCCVCKETFDKGWTDEEAAAERKELFGGPSEPTDVTVCEECFQVMRKRVPITSSS